MALSPTLDTAGFLTRDVGLWDVANAVLYGDKYSSLATAKPKYPTTVYTIGFPTSGNSAANTMLINFVNALTKFVGGTAVPISLATEWAASNPGGPTLTSLYVRAFEVTEPTNMLTFSRLNTTYATLISKEQIALVREPFYRDYAAVHDGRLPFVDPAPIARWGYGDSLPASALDDAIVRKTLNPDQRCRTNR